MRRQGVVAGFDFDEGGITVDGYEPLNDTRQWEDPPFMLSVIEFDGMLTVREPEIFITKSHPRFRSRQGIWTRTDARSAGLCHERRVAFPGLPPPRPIPLKDRSSIIFIEKGNVDVLDGAFVVVDKTGVRTHIPIGGLACLMLEPGARISHAAVALASRAGTLIVWVGEAGVRLYAAGQPGGARSDRLLYQARLALDEDARLKVVRKMYAMRFGEAAPERRSVDQLRGIEGVRVRKLYELIAKRHGVEWKGRDYDPRDFGTGDIPNRCLSAGTSCLYGLAETAVLAAGYAPAIGFLHTGKALSFVYDVADVFKFETVVPEAFRDRWSSGSREDSGG